MPGIIGKHHNEFLENYLDQQKQRIMNQQFVEVFGINCFGFLFPLKLRMKLDFWDKDFGVSGVLEQNDKQISDYILAEESGKVSNFSQRIYEEIFHKNFQENAKDLLKNINIKLVFPEVGQMLLKSQHLENINTCLIFPSKKEQFYVIQQKQDLASTDSDIIVFLIQQICQQFKHVPFHFYDVHINLHYKETSLQNFKYIVLEIQSFRKIRHKQEKYLFMQKLRNLVQQNFSQISLSPLSISKIQNTMTIVSTNTLGRQTSIMNKGLGGIDSPLAINRKQKQANTILRQSQKTQNSEFDLTEGLKNNSIIEQQHDENVDEQSMDNIQFKQIQLFEVKSLQKYSNNLEQLQQQQLSIMTPNSDIQLSNSEDQLSQINFIQTPNEQQLNNKKQKQRHFTQLSPSLFSRRNLDSKMTVPAIKTYSFINIDSKQYQTKNPEEVDVELADQNKFILNEINDGIEDEEHKSNISNCELNEEPPKSCSVLNENEDDDLSSFNSQIKQSQHYMQQDQEKNQGQSRSEASTHIMYKKNSQIKLFFDSQHTAKIITIANLTGQLSIISIIVLITISYFLLSNSILNDEKQIFDNLLLFPVFREKYSSVVLNTEYANLLRIDNLLYPGSQGQKYSVDQSDVYAKRSQKQLNALIDQFQVLTSPEVQYAKTQKVQLQFFDINGKFYKNESFSTFYIYLQLMQTYSSYTIKSQSTPAIQQFVLKNFQTYMNSTEQLIFLSEMVAIDNLNSLIVFSQNMFIIIEILCLIIILLFIPLLIQIQKKKESIIHLLATFNYNQLYQQLNRLNKIFLNNSHLASDISLKDHQQQIVDQKLLQIEIKTKTISDTTSLDKFDLKSLMFLLLFVIIISISPLVNYISADTYNQGFKETLQYIKTIYKGKMYFTTTFAWEYLQIQQLLAGETFNIQNYQLMSYIDQKNQESLNIFYSIENTLDQNKVKLQKFDRYVRQILRGDLCSILFEEYGQLIAFPGGYYSFFQNNCRKFSQGILQDGLVVTLKYLLERWKELFQIYQNCNSSTQTFRDQLIKFDRSESLTDMHLFFKIIGQGLDLTKSFIVQGREEYRSINLSQNNQIQQIIYIISIIILILTSIIVWPKIINNLSAKIDETNQMLGNISINLLSENQFILHYILQENQSKVVNK